MHRRRACIDAVAFNVEATENESERSRRQSCGRATVPRAQADGGERERTECERLREENETLRLELTTTEAELKHSSWLLRAIAWKYDLDLTDISTQIPSTAVAVVPLEEVTVSDEKRLHATEEVDLPKKAARQSRTPKHAVHATIRGSLT